MAAKLSQRDRRALLVLAVALGVIFSVRLIVVPWMDSWLAARDTIAADTRSIADLQERIAKVLAKQSRLSARYGQAIAKPLDDVETARMNLFKAVQEVVASNGFRPEDYQPQSDRSLKNLPGIRIVPVEIRGKCRTEQLAKCLAGMGKSQTLVLLDRLTTTADDKGSGELQVTMVLATLARSEEKR